MLIVILLKSSWSIHLYFGCSSCRRPSISRKQTSLCSFSWERLLLHFLKSNCKECSYLDADISVHSNYALTFVCNFCFYYFILVISWSNAYFLLKNYFRALLTSSIIVLCSFCIMFLVCRSFFSSSEVSSIRFLLLLALDSDSFLPIFSFSSFLVIPSRQVCMIFFS